MIVLVILAAVLVLVAVGVVIWISLMPDESELEPLTDPPAPVPVPAWIEVQFLPGEYAFYADNPQPALLVSRLVPNLLAVVALLVVAWQAGGWVSEVALIALTVPVLDAFIQYMEWARTMYVLTPLRAMRFNGWANTDVEWLSWAKVTEVSIRKTWIDYIFKMATIDIHTAHSASSFRAMRDVERPREFARDVAARSLL